MTVVIGYSSKSFSLLATDTRVYYGKGLDNGSNDNYIKLHSLPDPLGWCAAAGFTLLLSNFVEEISKNIEPEGYIDIGSISQRVFSKTEEDHPIFQDNIKGSKVFVTWFQSLPEQQSIHSILYFIELEKFFPTKANTFAVKYPHDVTDEKVEELKEKYLLDKEHVGTVDEISQIVFNLFNDMCKVSTSISDICDIGVQIDKSNGLEKYRIRETVDKLLR